MGTVDRRNAKTALHDVMEAICVRISGGKAGRRIAELQFDILKPIIFLTIGLTVLDTASFAESKRVANSLFSSHMRPSSVRVNTNRSISGGGAVAGSMSTPSPFSHGWLETMTNANVPE